MAAEDAAQRLVSYIQHLWGAPVAPADIAWATDLPVGKVLVEWLAEQVPRDDSGLLTRPHNVHTDNARVRSALEAIALDDEELRDARKAERLGFTSGSDAVPPSQYTTPATLRTRSRYLEEEADLLESETRTLKHRLKQATLASRQISQTIKSLQATVSTLEGDCHQHQERLAEQSVRTDTSIAQSASIVANLLEDLGAAKTQNVGSPDLAMCKSDLASLAALRAEIVGLAERRLRAVDYAERSLPSKDEIQFETARLSAQLYPSRSGGTLAKKAFDPERALAGAYDAELERLCRGLEGAEEDARAQLLQQFLGQDTGDNDSVGHTDVDIVDELSRAWGHDQAALLAAREDVLDQARDMLEHRLIPPLTALHERLSTTRSSTDDAEALISAFIEELEEVADDVASAHVPPTLAGNGTACETAPESLLEAALADLLKRRQDLRAPDAGPLVLLDSRDLAVELASASARRRAGERAEEAWLASVPARLSALSRGRAPLLSTIYAHAPVNTSAPFAPVPERAALEAAAHARAEGLGQAVVRLQKESELSGRDKRKLNAFVEQWAR